MDESRKLRSNHRNLARPFNCDNVGGRNSGKSDGSNLLSRLHETAQHIGRTSWACRIGPTSLCPIFRLHVLIHIIYVRANNGRQRCSTFRFLGTCRPVIISTHRLLVPSPSSYSCRKKGLYSYQSRGFRLLNSVNVLILQNQ